MRYRMRSRIINISQKTKKEYISFLIQEKDNLRHFVGNYIIAKKGFINLENNIEEKLYKILIEGKKKKHFSKCLGKRKKKCWKKENRHEKKEKISRQGVR